MFEYFIMKHSQTCLFEVTHCIIEIDPVRDTKAKDETELGTLCKGVFTGVQRA